MVLFGYNLPSPRAFTVPPYLSLSLSSSVQRIDTAIACRRKGDLVKTTEKNRDSLPNMLPLRSPPFKDEIAADVIPL